MNTIDIRTSISATWSDGTISPYRTFYYTDDGAKLFDTYNSSLESLKEQYANEKENSKIIDNILDYTKTHFRVSPFDLKYYDTKGFILSKHNFTKLNLAFTAIKKLDPKRYFYHEICLGEEEDVILSFRDTQPSNENFEKEIASGYFDVDEVWAKEIRLLKPDK